MDQTILVGPDISAGSKALAALDDAQIGPTVALLMASPESDDWRLVLSSPALDQAHSLKAYEQVTKALNGRFVTTVPPMLVLPLKDPFIREIRKTYGKTKDVEGTRLGSQMIGNRYVANAYVYRVS